VIARLAWQGIESHLARFTCCDGSKPFEVEVQEWIRTESWDWFINGLESDDTRLLILVDELDEEVPLAVVAHESDQIGRFVNAVGVSTENQRRGLGELALRTAFGDVVSRSPEPIASWLVHPRNLRMYQLSEKLGAEESSPAEDKPFIRFRIDLT
jgi:hypothetical protein